MIKQVLTAAAIAGMLGGCANDATISASVSQIVAGAIADAKVACALVPDAVAIGQIVAAGDPLLATASEIANAFCLAVVTQAKLPALAVRRAAVAGSIKGSVVIDGIRVPYTN